MVVKFVFISSLLLWSLFNFYGFSHDLKAFRLGKIYCSIFICLAETCLHNNELSKGLD